MGHPDTEGSNIKPHVEGLNQLGSRRFSAEMKKASSPTSVMRTYAPMVQTLVLLEWSTHGHLSAISAISPGGKLWLHSMIIIWDDAPIHHSHLIKAFLANGTAQRLLALYTQVSKTRETTARSFSVA
jgi:hypothetical protein